MTTGPHRAASSGGADVTRGLAALAALAFALLRLRPLDVPDLWWHLSMGRAALQSGARRFPDPTGPDPARQYVDPEWLFDVVLVLVHRLGGIDATFALIAVLAAASFLATWAACRATLGGLGQRDRAAAWAALVAALLAAGGAQLRVVQRPQAFFLVLLPLVILCGARVRSARSTRARWAWTAGGVAGLLAWSQSHSSVIIAPVVVAAALLPAPDPRRWSRPTWALLAAAALLPLTGAHGFGLIAQVVAHAGTDVAASLVDMAPPTPGDFVPWRGFGESIWGPTVALPEALVLLAVLGAMSSRGDRRGVLGVLALTALGLALVSTANRFLAAWAILAAPGAAAGLGQVLRTRERWGPPSAAAAAAAAFAATSWGVPLLQPTIVTRAAPADAVDALVALELPADSVLLNHFDAGGYLGWRLQGMHRVFIDGRTPTHFDAQHYFEWVAAEGDPATFARLDASYGFPAVVTEPDTPLCRGLASDPAWQARWWSPDLTVFARTSSEEQGPPPLRRLEPCAGPFGQLGRCGANGDREGSLAEIDALLAVVPSAAALARLGVLLALDCGGSPDDARAERYLKQATALDPRSEDLPWLWGLLAARRGQVRLAMDHLAAASPSPPVRSLRLQLLRAAERPEWALAEARALSRELGERVDPTTLEHLAWACEATGDLPCAVDAALAGAIRGDPAGRARLARLRSEGAVPEAARAAVDEALAEP